MHITRHTFAAGCIEVGMNPKTLKNKYAEIPWNQRIYRRKYIK